MLKINNKQWEKLTDEEKIEIANGLIEEGKTAKQKREMEWYLNYTFLDGNHYAVYNTTTNTLENRPKRKNQVRMVINTTKAKIRSIKNYVTREEPKWEVIPGDIDPDTLDNARKGGKVLDYIYRHLHLEQMVDGAVDSALNTSIAWVELDWDSGAEGGLGQVKITQHSSFDVIPDPDGFLYGGRFVGRYIAKSTRRALDSIKSDDRYDKKNRKKVVKDGGVAESKMKARLIRREAPNNENKKIDRAAVKELLLWEDHPNKGKGNIHLFVYSGDVVLRDEGTDFTEFPLYLLQVAMKPNQIYQRSWTADGIPINKAIDRFVSQKIMYVNQALTFRLIAEKGAYAGRITTSQGEIIEINKGRKFDQMAMASLPSDLDGLLAQLDSYLEDVLSSHEASTGALPAGARSGRTVEALQAAESNSLAGLNRSLRSFLEVIGRRILEIISEKYVASRVAKISEPEIGPDGEKSNHLKVIGESADKKPAGATIIHKDNELIVTIGSWLGDTREAKRETLLKLAEYKAIPSDEILRQFEFANIEELSRKAKEERLEEHEMDAEIAGRRDQAGAQAQQPAQPEADPLIELADKENMEMLNGKTIAPTEGADLSHNQAHRDFMKTGLFTSAESVIRDNVSRHTEGELKYLGFGR